MPQLLLMAPRPGIQPFSDLCRNKVAIEDSMTSVVLRTSVGLEHIHGVRL